MQDEVDAGLALPAGLSELPQLSSPGEGSFAWRRFDYLGEPNVQFEFAMLTAGLKMLPRDTFVEGRS